MLFLYDLPNWLLGILIVAVLEGLTFITYLTIHRLVHVELSERNLAAALTAMQVVATISSLLLAFSAVSVWESFGSADQAVVDEANTVSALAFDLDVFGTPQSHDAIRLLREYTTSVVNEEWKQMQRGEASPDSWGKFDEMFRAVASIEADTPRRTLLMAEILERANELTKERRIRLYTSQSEVPGTLWTVVLIGSGLAMATTFVLPVTRFNIGLIAGVALAFSLVFYFIVAMDRPFAGKESISAHPFEAALANMP